VTGLYNFWFRPDQQDAQPESAQTKLRPLMHLPEKRLTEQEAASKMFFAPGLTVTNGHLRLPRLISATN